MSTLQVFDRPMCCSSGVCGPRIDPVLPRFAADLEWLKTRGVTVERHNLAQQPEAFTFHEDVNLQVARHGLRCLPIFRVNGQIVCCGTYPLRGRMAQWLGVDDTPEPYLEGNCSCAPDSCG